jgi:hypothetical protein
MTDFVLFKPTKTRRVKNRKAKLKNVCAFEGDTGKKRQNSIRSLCHFHGLILAPFLRCVNPFSQMKFIFEKKCQNLECYEIVKIAKNKKKVHFCVIVKPALRRLTQNGNL